jgi:hypothetical protein
MQLRKFLSKFSGVRTKYLQNYLNWFAYGVQLNSNMNKMWAWIMTVATADKAYSLFQEFIYGLYNLIITNIYKNPIKLICAMIENIILK